MIVANAGVPAGRLRRWQRLGDRRRHCRDRQRRALCSGSGEGARSRTRTSRRGRSSRRLCALPPTFASTRTLTLRWTSYEIVGHAGSSRWPSARPHPAQGVSGQRRPHRTDKTSRVCSPWGIPCGPATCVPRITWRPSSPFKVIAPDEDAAKAEAIRESSRETAKLCAARRQSPTHRRRELIQPDGSAANRSSANGRSRPQTASLGAPLPYDHEAQEMTKNGA